MSTRQLPAVRLASALMLGATLAACAGSIASSQPATAVPSALASTAPTATAAPSASSQPVPSVQPPPVVLQASGDASLSLDGLPAFSANHGAVTCQSGPDVLSLDLLTALDLGTLSDATMRGQLHPPASATDPGSIELFIDGGDLPDGSFQPFWTGPGTFAIDADGVSGTVAFASPRLESDPKLPSPDPKWPAALTGRLIWRCDPWVVPGSRPSDGAGSPPPPSETPSTLGRARV